VVIPERSTRADPERSLPYWGVFLRRRNAWALLAPGRVQTHSGLPVEAADSTAFGREYRAQWMRT